MMVSLVRIARRRLFKGMRMVDHNSRIQLVNMLVYRCICQVQYNNQQKNRNDDP